jgi:multidrug efflux pump subunit AcrA (membrane-fusion protein)
MRFLNHSILMLGALAAFTATFASAAVEAPKPPATVFARTVKAEELFDRLTYPARVTPKISTTILSETDGIVSKIFAPLGQAVRKNQRIMTITHTDPVYQYAPTPIFASVSGVVSSVEVTEGTQVAKGEKLALVTDPTQIRITVEVPAMDLPMLRRGMMGEFKLPNLDQPVSVTIKGISPFVDPATGTATCELEVEKPAVSTKASAGAAATKSTAPSLPPGLIGQVDLKANDRKGISIPEFAVFYKGTEPFVRVIENGKAKQVSVSLGRRSRGNVEVLKGLSDGAKLVERTSRYIMDGEAVKVDDEPVKAEESGAADQSSSASGSAGNSAEKT